MKKILFALIALSSSFSSAEIVGEYQFDQSIINSSGTGYALSELGGSGVFVQDSVWGEEKYVLSLAAAQGLVADMSEWAGASDTYTVVMDVNLSNAYSYQKILSFDVNNASDVGLYTEYNDFIYYGRSTSYFPSDYVVENTWVRLAIVRSGNDVMLYAGIPGSMHLVGSASGADTYALIGSKLTFLQNDSCQDGEDYALKVSGIWISDHALSAGQVDAMGDYAPEQLLFEDFESINGGEVWIAVGSNVASAVAIDPDFSPAISGEQDSIEVGMGGEYWNAFGDSTAVDLNTVGLEWSFTVPSNRPNVQLSFDFGHDLDTQSITGSAILYRVLDTDNGSNVIMNTVFETAVVYDRTTHHESPTAVLRPGGSYIVQLVSDRYERWGGCMVDNVGIYAYPEDVSIETWDIGSDFLLASDGGSNPNNEWSYGWSSTDFSTFDLLTDNTSNWKRSDNENVIWKNSGSSVSYGVAPGQVSLHPGNEPSPTVLRWTAPEFSGTGSVHVAGEFFDGDLGTLNTAIRLNNSTSLWSGTVGTFDLNFDVQSGDTIDFAVYGVFAYGNTPIDARIALTTLSDSSTNLLPQVVLSVESKYGTPVPSIGLHTNDLGTMLTCSVDAVVDGGTNYVPVGWTMMGNEPNSGVTNSFTTSFTNDAALVWNWVSNYWLDVTVSGSGSVDQSAGWYAEDTTLNLVATPAEGWTFTGWSGDASGSAGASLTMDSAKSLIATFALDTSVDVSLEVQSAYGAPLPVQGTTVFANGTTVTCSVEQVTIGTTNYVPTGWTLVGAEPASGSSNWFETTLDADAVLTWHWDAVYAPSVRATNTVVLLEDDFNDASLDASKWTHITATGEGSGYLSTPGNSLTESGGTMNIAQATTDRGGAYKTKLLSVNSDGEIVITRRTKVHCVNHYTTMYESLKADDGSTLLRWIYGNYSYNDRVYMGFGGHYDNPRLPALWDQWFDETITYNPITGRGSMTINGQTVPIAGLPLPEGSDQVFLTGGAYGWWTGHTKQFDTFKVSQQSVTIAPTQVTLNISSIHASPSPSIGNHVYAGLSSVTCSASDVIDGDTQYECVGWKGTGSIPASGNGSQMTATLSEDSTITWCWQTNVWLDVSITGSGSSSHPEGWYPKGSVQNVSAIPSAGWLFMNWGGDASGTGSAALTMDSSKSITVLFSDDADDDGLTNSEEEVLGSNPRMADTDDDGFNDLMEIQFGLSPTTDNSAIIDYMEANAELFGFTTSNVVIEVGAGELLLEASNYVVSLNLQLEQSDDLQTWTNAGESVIWELELDEGQQFIRVKTSE